MGAEHRGAVASPPTDLLPPGVVVPSGADAAGLAAALAAAAAPAGESSREHLVRLARVARLELAGHVTDGLQPTLQRIVGVVADLLPCNNGVSIILHDPHDRTFLMSASTIDGQVPGSSATRVRSRGATRFIVDSGRPLYVHEVDVDPFGANAMLREAGSHSYVGVPMVVDGHGLGVLYAMAAAPSAFTAEDVDLLAVVADRAALVVHAATEHARVRRIAMRSEVLSLLTVRFATSAADDRKEQVASGLQQLALSVGFDLLVVDPTADLECPRLVVGPAAALVEQVEAGTSAPVLAELAADGRACSHLVEDGPLAGTVLWAARERQAVDDLDRSTLRHLGAVLAIALC